LSLVLSFELDLEPIPGPDLWAPDNEDDNDDDAAGPEPGFSLLKNERILTEKKEKNKQKNKMG
jgi:hypothetical protein